MILKKGSCQARQPATDPPLADVFWQRGTDHQKNTDNEKTGKSGALHDSSF